MITCPSPAIPLNGQAGVIPLTCAIPIIKNIIIENKAPALYTTKNLLNHLLLLRVNDFSNNVSIKNIKNPNTKICVCASFN